MSFSFTNNLTLPHAITSENGVKLEIKVSPFGGVGVFATQEIDGGTSLTGNFNNFINMNGTILPPPLVVASALSMFDFDTMKTRMEALDILSDQDFKRAALQSELHSEYLFSTSNYVLDKQVGLIKTVYVYDLYQHWTGAMNGVHPTQLSDESSADNLANVAEYTTNGQFITTKKILCGEELIWNYGDEYNWSN
jgi:hypothetical protein